MRRSFGQPAFGGCISGLGSEPGRWTLAAQSATLCLIRYRTARAGTPATRSQSGERRSAMPTYEYRCRDCKRVFDRVELLAEHGHARPECPKCKSKHVEQVLTPFFAKTAHKA